MTPIEWVFTGLGVAGMLWVWVKMIVGILASGGDRRALPSGHEHIGMFEEQGDGSQVRYCMTCNFKEVIPPPSPQREINCEEGLHNWGRWAEVEGGQHIVGQGIRRAQYRCCKSCGRREQEQVSTPTPTLKQAKELER